LPRDQEEEQEEEAGQESKELEDWSHKLSIKRTWTSQSELTSLVCKYESLANKYDHDIKSFSYRTKVE
jgi:hypothetical protein